MTGNLDNMNGPIQMERHDDIVTVSVDNPPVNTLSQPVRQALLDLFTGLARDGAVRAVVLTGSHGRFIAGADITELARPPMSPALRDVVAAIDAFPHPVVAAIDGAALGGGFELALACDYRVAASEATFALPEVKLGIIPGAGGTQRLPRLVGVAKAVELIAGGQTVNATTARSLSLVDEVVAGDLLAAAQAWCGKASKRRVSDMAVRPDPAEVVAATERDALRKGRGQPAVKAAIDAVKFAATSGLADGTAFERDHFLRLRDGPETEALQYLFFAERQAARVSGLSERPREVEKAVVIGGGTMGSGIAVALARSGIGVTLVERDEAALASARARIEKINPLLVASAPSGGPGDVVTLSADFSVVAQADLVIEAVFEDFEVKRELFARVDAVARPGAVLATNTSFLDIDRLAATTRRPQDVLGLHFFSPAHVMKLLEVVRGKATSEQTLATGLQLARRIGKLAVVAGVCDGFIGNRISLVYRRQCEFMLEEGAWPEDVDGAMEAFGFAMGPFAAVDLAGLDISWARRKAMASNRDPRQRYVGVADALCEAGRFGQKTGMGWYAYPNGGRNRQPDEAVRAFVAAASRERGLQRMPFAVEQMQRLALAAMVNEAALLIEEGIAQRASDIDVVFANGFGFPRMRGGPMFWAAHQPVDALARDIGAVEQSSGFGFRRATRLQEVLQALRERKDRNLG